MQSPRTNTGKKLNHEWKVFAQHALYRHDGTFYMPLERFPGAYFDASGYLIFTTKDEYQNCKQLRIGKRVDAPGGISKIQGYIKVK